MCSRLFLTIDPVYGELSRAMRNRGIELYICPSQVHMYIHTYTIIQLEIAHSVGTQWLLCRYSIYTIYVLLSDYCVMN